MQLLHFITLMASLSLTALEQVDCYKHPIYCQIIKNMPRMDRKKAWIVSNEIYKASKKHQIPADIFTAILAQESGYSVEAKNKTCGLDTDMRISCVYTDFGISQIHYKTAELYNLDIHLLSTDLSYSINAGAKILAYFKKNYGSDPDWYTRYNCGTSGTTSRKTCQIYKSMVERYMLDDAEVAKNDPF